MALYPTNNDNNNKNPIFFPASALIPTAWFWALPFFTLSYLCSVVERLISLFPSAHKHAHVGWLPGWWCGRWHHALTVLYSGSCSGRVHWMVAWAGTALLAVFSPSLPLFLSLSFARCVFLPSQHWLVQCALCSLGKRLIIQHTASIKFKFGSSSNLLAWRIYY